MKGKGVVLMTKAFTPLTKASVVVPIVKYVYYKFISRDWGKDYHECLRTIEPTLSQT
jgi:hypothetical protein